MLGRPSLAGGGQRFVLLIPEQITDHTRSRIVVSCPWHIAPLRHRHPDCQATNLVKLMRVK